MAFGLRFFDGKSLLFSDGKHGNLFGLHLFKYVVWIAANFTGKYGANLLIVG